MTLHRLDNVVQPYAWGSRSAFSELLGLPRSESPQAELWLGAHPQGPSRLVEEGVTLLERIVADPVALLGGEAARRFGGRLPYLLKVLAAERPLSLQAHPSADQARVGFAREEATGLALDDPKRNYRDQSHKPELLCALTPFAALCGFRERADLLALLDALELGGLDDTLAELRRDDGGRARAFRALFEMDAERRRAAIAGLVQGAERLLARGDGVQERFAVTARWSLRIAELYPDDPGVLAALFLNVVELEPGEAMFLPAGQLHAYLGGVGLEIMASSDNVLRGGLTSKHIDVPELMRVLRFEAFAPAISKGEERRADGWREVHYPTPAEEFCLSRIELGGGAGFEGGTGPEILLVLEGEVCARRGPTRVRLGRGESAFCAAAQSAYVVEGRGVMARARVPL